MAVAVGVYIFITPEGVLLDLPQVHVCQSLCMGTRCADVVCGIAVHLPYREEHIGGVCRGGRCG